MRNVLIIVGVAAAAGIGIWQTMKLNAANKLIDESNVIRGEATQSFNQALEKEKEFDTESFIASIAVNRKEMQDALQKNGELWGKAAERYRAAASKLDEAVNSEDDKVLKDYWSVGSEALKKYADASDAFQKADLVILDESVADAETLQEKRAPLIAEALRMNQEGNDADARAKKIQEENKSKIKAD